MKKSLIFAALFTAASLLAQGPPPGRGGRMGPGGPGPGFGVAPGMMRTVTGAPYSAVEVTETTQTLANGNVIQRKSQSNVYRDSMGRVRVETTVPARDSAAGQTMTRITIHDPVAGVTREVDPQAKTVREIAIPQGRGQGANGGRPAPQGRMMANGTRRAEPNTVTETLAMQTINGIQATGSRTTRTIPAGEIGNAQPIQTVRETWVSQDLKVPVMVKTVDPRFGTTTTQLTNITRSEPDASLFQAPADYTVTHVSGRGGMRGPGGGQIR
ncbi:MAG TPA: hypothetical protein VLY04_19245 [Bryobacteraceae bacterium]|nr:hypothetical protein [Bryobacteraceae bacterium]